VTYTAKDLAGNEATPRTRTVTVNALQNIAPTASITVSSTEITVGTTVRFSSENSSDEDGQIVRYEWEDDVENIVSEDSNFTHTFTHSGRFGIKLIVIDNDNAHGTSIVHINVTENNDTNASDDSIVGTITDIAGNALKGVKVYSASHETHTNADGYYVLETNGTSPVSIVAELSNYIQNSQVVNLDTNTTQNFTLVYIDKIETFDAQVGMEIKTKGAKINFPASSVSNEDGTAYVGKVTTKVAYNRVTSDIGQAAFPGEYIGETSEGNTTILRSYGFIDVTLEDNASNTLKVADGSSVTLTFPMDDNIDVKPETIPLWYYDTDKGIWVEDGVATYDEASNSYSGDVTHFTTWNLDAKMNPGSLKGCVEDSDGNPVTSALLNIEGAGWRSGLKQNSGDTFEFLRAPTGMPVTLTAYTAEGISQAETITLAPNENRVMTDCLVIEKNTTSPIVKVKGRLVDLDGELITGGASIKITNTDTGVTIASDYSKSGIIDSTIIRPNNNKITITIRINSENIVQSYILDPNKNTLNIGDIALDLIKITTHFVNRDGDAVEIVNNASMSIKSVSGEQLAYANSYNNRGATKLTSYNFVRPANNMVNLRVTYDGYVLIYDDNITIEGTTTDKNIVIPGINLHGTILLRDGTIFSKNNSIVIYDPDNLDKVLGWAKANNDGTFTTSYFTKPSSGQILLRVGVDDAKVDTIITLNDDTTVEIGNIETSLAKITGKLTNYSYGYTNGYTFIKILDTDNNNTDLGYANVTSNGSISSKYINMPESGNITLMFRKNKFNDVWVKKSYHFDANESLDVGTITLENASVTGTLTYLDGDTMPKGITIRTSNTDYVDNNPYNINSGATSTLLNGQMDTKDFYKPGNGQVNLVVDLPGNDYNVTIDLDGTSQVTNKDLSIDAIIITGTALYPHDNSPANGFGFSSPQTNYLHSLGTSDINGTFTLGPILRPNDTNITLIAQRYSVQGQDKGSTVNILPDTHITDIGEHLLNTSFIKGCVALPDNGFNSFKVRYNDPFSSSDISGYQIRGHVNKDTGTFDMMMWQTDTNNSLYIFATDTENKNTTKALTFTANSAVVDYTNPCINLDNENNTTRVVDVSVTGASLDSSIDIQHATQRYYYNAGTNIFQSSLEEFSFDINKNGIYSLKMRSPSSKYSGTISITIDGITRVLTIPINNPSNYIIGWSLFEIEVYQGNITIHTINTEEKKLPD